ncbi:MAG TPA: hypothetical protein VGF94_27965 [Kofleriaceae bacterium]
MPATPPADLDELVAKLRKRGFRQDDVFLHVCPACDEKAVAIFVIAGRTGGRDIRLCTACGDARSWHANAGLEERAEDSAFDLRAFLR